MLWVQFFYCSFEHQADIFSPTDPHKGGVSDLKDQEQFMSFFKNIEVINEPFEDLSQHSREIMKKYFLSISNFEAAGFYS